MKESTFQTNVKHYLEDQGAYVVNVGGGGYQTAGVPDLLVCYKGVFIGLELKVPGNTASERQIFHLEQINNASGFGVVFYYSKDGKEILHEYLTKLSGVTTESIENLKQTVSLPERSASKTRVNT